MPARVQDQTNSEDAVPAKRYVWLVYQALANVLVVVWEPELNLVP